jgi:hypothetical protein
MKGRTRKESDLPQINNRCGPSTIKRDSQSHSSETQQRRHLSVPGAEMALTLMDWGCTLGKGKEPALTAPPLNALRLQLKQLVDRNAPFKSVQGQKTD